MDTYIVASTSTRQPVGVPRNPQGRRKADTGERKQGGKAGAAGRARVEREVGAGLSNSVKRGQGEQ